jgi:hypothetical protein
MISKNYKAMSTNMLRYILRLRKVQWKKLSFLRTGCDFDPQWSNLTDPQMLFDAGKIEQARLEPDD